MKAMLVGSPATIDTLHLAERPDPGQPAPGQIRVALHGSSLNFHDLGVVTGITRAPAGRIPLTDGGGTVEAVGEGVTEFAPGDQVISCFYPDWQDGKPNCNLARVPGDGIDGYAAECVIAPATAFTHAPRGYDAVEAATVTTAGLTAWRALVVDGGLKPGDAILLLGTGGVSIWALQIAKAMGATAVVTSSSDEKLERARQLGADHTINYREVPAWGRAVRDCTGGGVDLVLELGGAGTMDNSIGAVRQGGHIALIGTVAGVAAPISTVALLGKQAKIQGLMVGSRRHQQDLVRAIDSTGLRPVIDRRFALEELADAFRYQQSGAHFGKVGIGW